MHLWKIIFVSYWLIKAHVHFIVELPIYVNLLFIMPFCTLVFVGVSGLLLEMIKGLCLEPTMLYWPPLTSPKCECLELPIVGDFFLMIIQKWMNHILFVNPLYILCIWYNIYSFGYVFLYVLWIEWYDCNVKYDIWTSISYLFFDMLQNASYVVDIFWNISHAIDMFQNASYASEMFICHWYTLK